MTQAAWIIFQQCTRVYRECLILYILLTSSMYDLCERFRWSQRFLWHCRNSTSNRMYTSTRTSTSTQTSTRYSKDGEDVQIVNSSAVRHTINYWSVFKGFKKDSQWEEEENFSRPFALSVEALLWHSSCTLNGYNQSLPTFVCGNRLFATDAHRKES